MRKKPSPAHPHTEIQKSPVHTTYLASVSFPMDSFPSFDDLPLRKEGPPGNAWGLYGEDDQFGRLNLLTPAVVSAAASGIVEGTRVSLDWGMDNPTAPAFKRQRFQHDKINKAPRAENDDSVCFNTQSSTHWDGFRHFGTHFDCHSVTADLRLTRSSQGTSERRSSTTVAHRATLRRARCSVLIVRSLCPACCFWPSRRD